ncbi:MAG: hypothetical protein IIT39_05535, partial [Clostridia bacterium]|nr:hypothetical protein [Clostridia bacterium]
MKKKIKNFYSKKSMFRKYMNVSVLIVFFSFLILGIILTLTITNYWSNEKRQVMDRRADTVVSFIRRHSAIDPSLGMGVNKKFYISQLDTVQELLRLYVDDVGIDVIVTDIDANPVMIVNSNSSDSMDIDKVMNSQISSDIVDKTIQDSEYFSKGTLDGIYKTDKYISARPIYYNSQSNVMGIVMVISDTKDIAS